MNTSKSDAAFEAGYAHSVANGSYSDRFSVATSVRTDWALGFNKAARDLAPARAEAHVSALEEQAAFMKEVVGDLTRDIRNAR